MIRECKIEDFKAIYEIINDAARAYEGVIPEDCYNLSYMSEEALKNEIASGITFYGLGKKENQQALWAFRSFLMSL